MSTMSTYTMAHSANESRWAGRPIPTLEGSYDSLVANLSRIVNLIEQHMATGHLQDQPWEEASRLRTATAHDVFILDCLWQSEADVTRFENLRQWVAIVKADTKSKLKALDLFVRLRERQRLRTEPTHQKPCNPPSDLPEIRGAAANDIAITATSIRRPTEQAMPNTHREHGTYVPHKIETACGMDPKLDAQIGRTHTVQPSKLHEATTTSTRPGIATNTKRITATGSNTRASPRNESTQHPTTQIHPQTQYLAPQNWEGDSKTLPRYHSTRAQQWQRDNANNETGNPSCRRDDIGVVYATNEISTRRGATAKYLQPRIRDPTTSSRHVIYNLPGHDTMSPDPDVNCYNSHEQQIPWAPQMSDLGDQTSTPRQRFLKSVTIIDDEDTDAMRIRLLQAMGAETNNLQKQCTNESEHRKRRHATKKYEPARLPKPGHDDKLTRLK